MAQAASSRNYAAPSEYFEPLTDLRFLEPGAPWPPPSQKSRMTRYDKNKLLWKGHHDEVFGNWWKVLRDDKAASLEIILGWHKRLSTLWADLLLSEAPRFFDGEDAEETAGSGAPTEASNSAKTKRQEAIDRITNKDDNGYIRTLYKITLDISRFGDGVAKISLGKDGAKIKAITPAYWFPVVSPDDLEEYTHHVLGWKYKVGEQEYLRIEVHEKGFITHRTQAIGDAGVLGERERMGFYSDEGRKALTENPEAAELIREMYDGVEPTNCDDFLVVPFKGLEVSDEIFGDDDYTQIDSLVAALETRAGQINRVLDKHTDPSMYGPPGLMRKNPTTGKMEFKSGNQYYEVDEDDIPPGYVTWDGQLEAQFKEMETILQQLYIISETSPAAFGQIEGNLAESGSALRRLMQAPLAKVARMTMSVDPSAKRCIKIASQLETNNAGHNGVPITKVNIQWQDGLPPDPKEQAETEHFRRAALNTSTVSSIRRLDGGTQEEAQAEYERIKTENQEAAELEMQKADHEAALKERQEAKAGNTPGSEGAVKTSDKNKEKE